MAGTGRFTLVEDLEVFWIPNAVTIANLAALSIATHIGAVTAVDLVGPLNGEGLVGDSIQGFEESSARIPTPDYKTRVVGTVGGDITIADSSMAFYAHKTQSDIRTALIADAGGRIVFAFTGVTAAAEYEIWPCTVLLQKASKARNEAHTFMVEFSTEVKTEGAFVA